MATTIDLHRQHQSTQTHSSSWIRLVIAPFLLILAAVTCTHAEAPSGVTASVRVERNGLSTGLRTPQQQNSHPANKKRRRRQRQRQAQERDDVPTLNELLDNAIEGKMPTMCTLNDNGLYGDQTGGSNVADVDYLYQVSVVTGTTASQLNNVILPELDAAIPTAVLPVFFPAECSSSSGGGARRQRHQRQLQGGRRVHAISMMPQDELVLDGLTCTKSVPNTACYVTKGAATVIGSGFTSDAQLANFVRSVIQAAVQGNALIQSLNTNLVVDVTFLADNLQTLPPITPAPIAVLAPVAPVPAPTTPTETPPSGFDFPSFAGATEMPAIAPARTVPTPIFDFPTVMDGTVEPNAAPIPRPIDEPPAAPSTLAPIANDQPTQAPAIVTPTPAVAPSLTTLAPIAKGEPTQAPAFVTLRPAGNPPTSDAQTPNSPTTANDSTNDPPSTVEARSGGESKVEWWAWLLAVVGGLMLILCCLSIARKGSGGNSLVGGDEEKSASRQQKGDDDREEAYQPPPSAYVPPGMGAFSVAPAETDQQPTLEAAAVTLPPPPSGFVNNMNEDHESEDVQSVSEEPGDPEDDDESYTEGDEDGSYQDGMDDEEVYGEEGEYYEEDEGEGTFAEEEESETGTWGAV